MPRFGREAFQISQKNLGGVGAKASAKLVSEGREKQEKPEAFKGRAEKRLPK